MLFDRIPHENKYILEPKEIADYLLFWKVKLIKQLNI